MRDGLREPFPFLLPRAGAVAVFVLAAVSSCFDFLPEDAPGDLRTVYPVLNAILLLLLLPDREGRAGRRLAFAAAGVLGAVALGLLLHAESGFPLKRMAAGIPGWGDLGALAALLWVAAPLLLAGGARRPPGALRPLAWALLAYAVLCFGSAMSSVRPWISLEDFARERVWSLGLAFAFLRAGAADPQLARRTGAAVLRVLAATALLGVAIGCVDLLGGEGVRQRLHAWGLVFVEKPGAENLMPARRLLFPLRDFNPASGFYLSLLFLLPLSLFRATGRPRGLDRLAGAGGAAAFCALVFTSTRTALFLALAGGALWIFLAANRRWRVGIAAALLLGGGAVIALMPAPKRAFFLAPFQSGMYTSTGPLTSMQERILTWRWGIENIREHPWGGLGYGYRNIRALYADYCASDSADARLQAKAATGYRIQHLHNAWLETAAESGLPAAAALLLFTLLRWRLVWRCYVLGRGPAARRAAGWLALEFALFLFSLLFHLWRRNFGYFFFFLWAYVAGECARTLEESGAGVTGPASRGPLRAGRAGRLAAGIFVLALAVRLAFAGFLLHHQSARDIGRLTPDGREYLALAERLSERGAYGDPGDRESQRQALRRPPGYPVFCIAAQVLGNPPRGVLWAQALLGAWIAAGTALLVQGLCKSRAAAAAAGVALAFSPTSLALGGAVLPDVLLTALLLAGLLLLLRRAAPSPSGKGVSSEAWLAAGAGLVFAAAALVKPVLLLWPPVSVGIWWLLGKAGGRAFRWRPVLILAGVQCACILVWCGHNQRSLGVFEFSGVGRYNLRYYLAEKVDLWARNGRFPDGGEWRAALDRARERVGPDIDAGLDRSTRRRQVGEAWNILLRHPFRTLGVYVVSILEVREGNPWTSAFFPADSRTLRGMSALDRAGRFLFYPVALLALLGLAGAVRRLLRGGPGRAAAWRAAALGAVLAYFTVLSGFSHSQGARILFPGIFAATVLAVYGGEMVAGYLRQTVGGRRKR